jgi:hypothetical protein
MWAGSVMLLRPTPGVFALLDRWEDAARRFPGEWDQACLQIAWDEMTNDRPTMAALPDAYRFGGDFIAHNSGFHRHWSPRMPQRWTLIGPEAMPQEWSEERFETSDGDGTLVATVGEAWRLGRSRMNLWIPGDRYSGEEPPGADFRKSVNLKRTPYWDAARRSPLADAALHVLNHFHGRDQRPAVKAVGFGDDPLAGYVGEVYAAAGATFRYERAAREAMVG